MTQIVDSLSPTEYPRPMRDKWHVARKQLLASELMLEQSVAKWFKRGGKPKKSWHRHDTTTFAAYKEQIIKRYLQGESFRSLGRAYGMAGQTVHDILKRHGIKRETNEQNN
jgi:DNA invertase Pin-like site-specific DNA recombinase